MCVGISKKTQVIKGELNPAWNEVRLVKLNITFVYFCVLLTLEHEIYCV